MAEVVVAALSTWRGGGGGLPEVCLLGRFLHCNHGKFIFELRLHIFHAFLSLRCYFRIFGD